MSAIDKRRTGYTRRRARTGATTWARTPAARARIHRAAKRRKDTDRDFRLADSFDRGW